MPLDRRRGGSQMMMRWPSVIQYIQSLVPVMWLQFNETTGTNANDSTANDIDGTYVNTPDLGGSVLLNQPAPLFSAAQAEFVQLDHVGLESVFDPDDGTILLALNLNQANWESASVYFFASIGVDADNRLLIYKNAAESIRLRFEVGNVFQDVTLDVPTSWHGNWVYAIATWNRSDNEITLNAGGVDGSAVYPTAGTWSASDLAATYCSIGGQTAIGGFVTGAMGQAVLYDYALSADQVASMAARFAQLYPLPTTVTLPQNLLGTPGTLIEGYENTSGLTISTGAAAQNTTQFLQGAASVKQTSQSGGAGQIQKDGTFDLSDYVAFRRRVYSHDSATSYTSLFWFQGGDFYLNSKNTPPADRWTAYNLLLSDFVVGSGTPNWANPFTRWRNWVVPTAGVTEASHDWLEGLTELARPAVLIAFDDGDDEQYAEAFAYMNPRNIPGTLNAITGIVGNAGVVTWVQLQEMNAAGWDIGNHSIDAVDLTTLSQAQVESNLETAQAALEARGLTRASKHVAYPGGAQNSTVIAAMTAAGMLTGRLAGGGNTFLPLGSNYHITTQTVQNTTTLAAATGWIDTAVARGEVVVILLHRLVASPSIPTEWSIANFQGLIDYIVAQEIQPLTISQLYNLQSSAIAVPRIW